MDISYSNGKTVKNAVIVIWEDNHNQRSGFYRAYWSDSPNGTCGSPVIGYCSPNGSYKRIYQVLSEVKRLYPKENIYRNGKLIYSPARVN